MAEVFKKDIPVVAPAFRIPRNSGTPVPYPGNQVRQIAVATYDTAVNDSAGVSNKTIASHGMGVYIPINAIITNVWYDVITTFTSATDAATIASTIQTAGDGKVGIAISDASNVWDAGLHGCLPGSYAEATVAGDSALLDAARKAASYVKLTAEREIVFTVAVEVLTAGKLNIFVEYVLSA